ncbi:hypothetical protein TcCL_ESM05548 [Trypanosoma cruzi]|nr:hypothetical protein TcCL_ESM05548 [Trypanosoma cruzi]
MDFEPANDPAQATRITHPNASSPDVTAYRVLRISSWKSTPYMDSDHCLICYSVGMDDGIPRIANTLPRRDKATFALRKADWPASTSSSETLLATASTWLDLRRGIVRAAERHIPRGSRESPKIIWTHEMEQAESAAEAGHQAHIAFPGNVLHFTEFTRKRGNEIKPYAVASLCFWNPARKNLGLHPTQAGDIFAAWRRRTLILWNWLCSELNLAAYALCLGNRQTCLSVILCGFTCHVTLYFCRCSPHSLAPGDWEMDWPLTPYELDVTIRDSLLGSAPGPDDMLNEFLHHPGPVVRGTIRTMINNSFANGSLTGSWKMGSLFLSQTWEGSMPPRELQTYHAALCFTKVNRRND